MDIFFNSFQLLVLALYAALFLGRIIYLRYTGKTRAISITINKDRTRGILTISLIAAIVTWITLMLGYLARPELQFLPSLLDIKLLDSLPTKFIGTTSIALGMAIFTMAWISLGNSWRVGNAEERTGELIRQGIYDISRNPIYIFLIFLLSGAFLINGTLIFLIFAILVAFNLHYLTLAEERFLVKVYTSDFEDYCTKTNRYITWSKIWPISRLQKSTNGD